MKYSCINCGKTFQTNEKLKEHEVIHEKQTKPTEYNCTKCDKAYVSMSKLRRHDWRSHRVVDCSICGETLSSRQEIGCHRQNEHQLSRIANCKFFPNCIDENECFFKHDQVEVHGESNGSRYFCKEGENCSDQSCSVSEANHKKSRSILCKFQANCNRLNCSFKHNVERKSFLEEGISNSEEK